MSLQLDILFYCGSNLLEPVEIRVKFDASKNRIDRKTLQQVNLVWIDNQALGLVDPESNYF